eukprot:UN05088
MLIYFYCGDFERFDQKSICNLGIPLMYYSALQYIDAGSTVSIVQLSTVVASV